MRDGGETLVVEQDTAREVAQCVLVCLRTPIGSRSEDPAFGVDQLLFRRAPLDLTAVLAQVERCEPRAALLEESHFAELVEEVVVKVGTVGR